MSIRDELAEIDPDLMLMDGFDDCILGICESFGGESVVAYDYDKVIASLESQGMTYEEAVEVGSAIQEMVRQNDNFRSVVFDGTPQALKTENPQANKGR